MTMTAPTSPPAIDYLLDRCADLDLRLDLVAVDGTRATLHGPNGGSIEIEYERPADRLQQVLDQVVFDFDELPQLVVGDSKDIRLLTPSIALVKLLPTVYSFTQNRYGVAPGSAASRARFSADVFRAMAARPGRRHLSSAFLGLVETADGPLLAEEVVEDCNLEVRVKRYHIGSPTHRYRFTERHRSIAGPPVGRWTRFERPVVCFDWRHPLTDEEGTRLADEPISDDYAGVWMGDVASAKQLATDTFEWLEDMFDQADLQLIDICFFIDRSGRTLYGEISPDCMRVRDGASDDAEALDKDVWRSGGTPGEVRDRYEQLHERVGSVLRAAADPAGSGPSTSTGIAST